MEGKVKAFTDDIPKLEDRLDNFISEANSITKRYVLIAGPYCSLSLHF